MKYLCLVFYDEHKRNAVPEPESQAMIDSGNALVGRLRQSGHLVTAYALVQTPEARTVRFDEGKPSVTDGPFAETKEQIAGFLLLEASGMDEALEIASQVPPARLGGIEVRAVIETARIEYWKEKPVPADGPAGNPAAP